jgi:hypothetical protein
LNQKQIKFDPGARFYDGFKFDIKMVFQGQYLIIGCLLTVYYLLTWMFPMIHKLCLFGGMINILINIQSINPTQKIRIVMKNDNGNGNGNNNADPERPIQIQFYNLYKGFKYGIVGYFMTIGIFPYYIYMLVNPEKSYQSFKDDIIFLFMRLMSLTRAKWDQTNQSKLVSNKFD